MQLSLKMPKILNAFSIKKYKILSLRLFNTNLSIILASLL